MSKVDQIGNSPIKRGRGRPKKASVKTINYSLALNGFNEVLVFDRAQSRPLIHVTIPTSMFNTRQFE